MGLNKKLILILWATLMLAPFQNCTPVNFSQVQESTFSKVKFDNGSVFDGKPTYYLTRPDYTCEGQLAPMAVIRFEMAGPHLTFNQNDHCAAIDDQPISSSDLDQFAFDNEFLGYRDGIYERQSAPPDFASPIYNEAYCQSTGTGAGAGLTVAIKFDSDNNGASSRIHFSDGMQMGPIKSFSVGRILTDSGANYLADGFRLQIDRSQPAPEKWWYFNGQLETDKVPGSWKGSVLCRMAASKRLANVQKIYPQNSDWNSYVKKSDPSQDILSQSDLACSGASSWNQCFHGGDKLVVETELKGCSNLTAKDDLDSFNWSCEDKPSGAVFKTSRLKTGRGLSNLVTKTGWKSNWIQVLENGKVRYESIALPWWKNPVVPLADSGSTSPVQLNVAKAVYVADSDLQVPGVQFAEDGISLIMQNGAKLSARASLNPNCNLSGMHFSAPDGTFYPTRCLVSSENHGFLWIEGRFDSTGSNSQAGLNLQNGYFIRLQNVSLENAAGGFGLFQETVVGSVLDSVVARGNRHGMVSRNSSGNLIGSSDFSNNSSTGLWLTAWDNQNTILHSRATQNGITGFAFNSTRDLVMISSRTQSNVVRGFEITGFTENARFESILAFGDSYGLDINRSDSSLQPNFFKDTALMSTTLGLRVFEGTGANKEVFEGQLFSGSTAECSVIRTPAIDSVDCPGSGLPGSEIFSLPSTSLTKFMSCTQTAGGGVTCPGGASWSGTCQLPDGLSNPLINGSNSANTPFCSKTDVLD